MKSFVYAAAFLFLLSGCSATWSGIKEDTSKAVDWTKEKIK